MLSFKIVLPLIFSLTVLGRDLPDNFEKCKRDENFDKCLVEAVNKALVLLKDGNKEFGVPQLEPMTIKSLVVDSGNAPINLKQSLKNIKVNDLISSSKVVRYRYCRKKLMYIKFFIYTFFSNRTQLDKHLIICDSFSGKIEILGDYTMSGRILLLPITGSGKANLTLVNTKIEHRLIGEPYEQDGVKYMKLKDYKVSFDPKRVYIHFENLFNDKVLSETMNRFLNENWEIAFNELKIGYSKSFGKIFKEISNRIFTKVPFDQIFLSP
ncbi:hypothetical protein ACFFRR_000791 [Megaselia abdita]